MCVIQLQRYAADRRTGDDRQRELHLARRPRLHELLRQQQGNQLARPKIVEKK